MDLKAFYSPIQNELDQVEAVLCESLTRDKYERIKDVGVYLSTFPGKRIRPALALFSFKALQPNQPVPDQKSGSQD